MPRKCTCTHSIWTSVSEVSYPVLWTGSCSEDWLSCSFWHIGRSWQQWYSSLTLDGSKQGDSHLAMLRDPGWELQVLAKWWPPACWGTISLWWKEILWAPGSPSPHLWPCVWQLMEEHSWEAGHWDGKDFRPFWNWLAEKNWSKEYFQTGDSGSRHPRLFWRWCHKWMVSKGTRQSFWNQPSEFKSPVSM